MMDRPGANESLERARAEYEMEIRRYELRHAEALSQTEATGQVEIAHSAVAKLEHAEGVSVSTLPDYLDAIGARLELV
ncbi:MAG: XRE family transcriptional regulator, partial [Acidimicrobiales bacterium]